MAPAAMTSAPTRASPSVHPRGAEEAWFSAGIHVPIVNGAARGGSRGSVPQSCRSRRGAPPKPSDFAERIPVLPVEWSAGGFSAAAIPLGKRSCSDVDHLSALIGMAMVTPSTASRNTHASMSGSESVALLTSMYAAKAEMSVPPVE